MPRYSVIAFDADDTLWHNEQLFLDARARSLQILDGVLPRHELVAALERAQLENLQFFGYGIKGFVLSNLDMVARLAPERLSGHHVAQMLELAKRMFEHKPLPIEQAEPCLRRLHGRWPLWLLTKGDPLDQKAKLRHSGLEHFFDRVEIFDSKTPQAYAALLRREGVRPHEFIMVGNSLRSDVLPVCQIGATAVHVPSAVEWEHERVEPAELADCQFHSLQHLGQFADFVEATHQNATP